MKKYIVFILVCILSYGICYSATIKKQPKQKQAVKVKVVNLKNIKGKVVGTIRYCK